MNAMCTREILSGLRLVARGKLARRARCRAAGREGICTTRRQPDLFRVARSKHAERGGRAGSCGAK